jgi:hypothetical protein
MIVLFTGMSGIDIEHSINNYIQSQHFLSRYSKFEPEIIKLETEIEEVFYDENPDIKRDRVIWLNVILKQTYVKLEKYWTIAFNRIITKVDAKKSANKPIFICLHACYFHNKTQEYISLVKVNLLKEINPDLIITFIDDVYDIHERLSELGGIYNENKNPNSTEMILRYLRLLDWRSKETMMARFLAKQLGIKNYLFATKHPYETLSNLIFELKKVVYFSHPISEVRRLEKQQQFERATSLKREISQLSNYLNAGFSAFLPTTIDELRVLNNIGVISNAQGKSKEIRNFYPSLTERWEHDKYKQPENIFYLETGFDDSNSLWKKDFNIDTSNIDEVISQLLTALVDFVIDQVSTRDYTLVEQSDVLVIYRPLFNGNTSGGVLEEFDYFNHFQDDLENTVTCFIYCPQKDIDAFYVKELNNRILSEIEDDKMVLRNKATNFLSISANECGKLIEAGSDKLVLLGVLEEILNNHGIDIDISKLKGPLGKNKYTLYKNEFIDDLLEVFEPLEQYKRLAKYFETNDLTVQQFYANIVSKLKSDGKDNVN